MLLTDFLEVVEPHTGRFAPHLFEDFRGRRHAVMVPIVTPLFNSKLWQMSKLWQNGWVRIPAAMIGDT
jgi:hypothetical protein